MLAVPFSLFVYIPVALLPVLLVGMTTSEQRGEKEQEPRYMGDRGKQTTISVT